MNLLVIDGNSIVNRAFYGIRDLTTKDGLHTNAIYGFMTILLKLKEQTEPDAVAVAFDLKAPTFRHKMYAEYKAGRHPMPEELAEQIPVLKDLLDALGIKVLQKEGYEADDILGTLSRVCAESGGKCYIATGDRDSLQLVNENVTVILASTKRGQSQSVFYTPEKVKEDYGVSPLSLIDVKAIQGDSSDNIPGVAGIGVKGATALVSEYGTIEYIYNNIDTLEIKDSVRKKLSDSKDICFLSYKLGKICLDAPVDTDIEAFKSIEPDEQKARTLLARLEMRSVADKLGFAIAAPSKKDRDEKYTVSYEIVSDLNAFLKLLQQQERVYFTADFDGGSLEALAFNVNNRLYYVPNDSLSFFEFIEGFFESDVKKYTDSSKRLFSLASNHGVRLKNLVGDVSLAGYVLSPDDKDYSALTLAQKEEYRVNVPEIQGEKSDNNALKTAAVLPLLSQKTLTAVSENGQEHLLKDIEIPLAEVLSAMETEGFKVDADGISAFGKKLSERIEQIRTQIYEYVGREFNLNSPKQLGEALFEDLNLPHKKKTKSGYSTKAEVLESLAEEHPVIPLILEYRALSKLNSTYCEGLLKVILPDGRIHSSFIQTETRTGRISSAEPNLQNIPVRTKLGAEMRKFFVAKDGYVLVDADYSQIELRVLAHIADDENMINAFNNGDDIHAITASQVFGVPLSEVTPQMRTSAKAVNFGIVYGIGAFSLAKDIGVSRAEADSYIKGYLMHYSGIDNYMKNVVEKAREDGFVTTLSGRRRYLPDLAKKNHMLRAFSERVARNMPIQGTAADIIKIAMVKVFRRLREENLNSRLILQVHDELIIEAREDEREYICRMLKEEMENAFEMKVKLLADVHCGKTWFEAKG